MKICYYGDYLPNYSRNLILLKGLRRNHQTVVECNYPFPKLSTNIISIYKNIKAQIKILSMHAKISYDAIIVGYPLVKAIWSAKIIKKQPLIIDPFISNYNTIINDLKLYPKESIFSSLLHLFDKTIFASGKIVLADTKAHAKYFSSEFGIPIEKFKVIYVGADNDLYFPREDIPHKQFTVGFYGNYIPLQGIEYIIDAANILKGYYPHIKFELIGGNKKNNYFRHIIHKIYKLQLKNIRIIRQINEYKLPYYIQKADIQLGIFGDSIKTRLVIPNKAYTALAMKKPLITSETIAIKELFKDKFNCLLCNRADPVSLANKILKLYENEKLRTKIANNGFQTYLKNCTPQILAEKLLNEIKEI